MYLATLLLSCDLVLASAVRLRRQICVRCLLQSMTYLALLGKRETYQMPDVFVFVVEALELQVFNLWLTKDLQEVIKVQVDDF